MTGRRNTATANSALANGLAILRVDSGVVKFGDLCSTWHPNDNQNTGFKYVVNQRKIWNIAKSIKDSTHPAIIRIGRSCPARQTP